MTNRNIIKEFESYIVVESIDRDFDDSNYNDPNILQGEMKILEDAESPEEFIADNKTLIREKFSPNDPKTWLLNITPDNYFAGLRQILKDDDPIFNSNMVTMFPSTSITTLNLSENIETFKPVNIEPTNFKSENVISANVEHANNRTKFVILGRELAPWLDQKLAKYRIFFTLLNMLLFAASLYAGINNLCAQHIIVLSFLAAFVAIFLIKSVVLYLVKKATIYNRKKSYLDSEKDIHPEVYKALKHGKYSELMTPKELELVQGLCVYTKTKNDKTVYHLGNNNF